MDVTKRNFSQVILEIERNIDDCNFIAIDLEFTGLYKSITNDFLDTHEQYYAKCRSNIDQFQILQVGMSFFKMINEREFDCHSYNFYIFPNRCHILPRQEKERYFQVQASSLTFLSENGFDFNKLIKEGISYLNLSQVKYVSQKVNERNSDTIQVISEVDKAFIEETMKLVTDFVNDKTKQELVLPQANAYMRRLIYEAVYNSEYQDQLDLSANNADKQKITVKRSSPEEKKERARLSLLEMIGFTEIIRLLAKNPKPLVGHNLYLDILYIYNTFVGPLSEEYAEFKSLFHGLFPTIYDTRYISSEGILNSLIPNNCLSKLYLALLQHPFLQTVVNSKNGEYNQERFHEAGYDSFITGCCFINLIRYLYAQEFVKVTDMFSNNILTKYQNKVGMPKNYDIKYMDLAANDIVPVRNHVFHLSFPSNWKTSNIHTLFNDFGGLYNVTYINDTSAFCILKEAKNAPQAIERLICKNRSTSFKLQLYADFLERSMYSANIESKRTIPNTVQTDESDSESPQPKKIKKVDKSNAQEQLNNSIARNINELLQSNPTTPKNNLFEVPSWNSSDS